MVSIEIDYPFLFKILDSLVELIIFMLAIYCANIMIKQYKAKGKSTALSLSILFTVLALAPIFQFMDGLLYPIYYSIKYGYAFILLLTAIANLAIFYFALEIFLTKEKFTQKFKLIYFAIAILEMSITAVAFIFKLIDKDVTLLIGAQMAIGGVIYLILAIQAFRLSKKIQELLYQKSIRFIGFFAISLLAVYTFFILDSFYSYYTVWGFLGWSMWLVSTYLAYYGFARPIVIQNRSEKQESDRGGVEENHTKPNSMKYFIFLLVFMGLYEIFDSYTTTFYPMVVSFVLDDFGINISEYYVALSMASLGLYCVIIIAFMMDKIGRKPMIILVFFGMGLGSYFLGLSNNLSQFTSSLFLMFIFFSSDVWVLIISEEAPKEKRAQYSYIVMLIGTIGVFIIPVLRGIVIDTNVPHTWINMTKFAWLAMGLAFLGLFVKETRAFQTKQYLIESENKWSWARVSASIGEPFNQVNRPKTIGFIIIGFVLGLNYTTLQTIEEFLSSNIVDQDTVNSIIFIAGAGSILVYLITGAFADKIGRKKVMISYSILFIFAISGIVFSATNKLVIGIYFFTILSQMGYWGCFSLSKMYCVECFETQIRGSATGWRSFAYAVGLTIGALISSALTEFTSLGNSYIINALWIVIFIPIVITKLLPETKGCELVETMEN